MLTELRVWVKVGDANRDQGVKVTKVGDANRAQGVKDTKVGDAPSHFCYSNPVIIFCSVNARIQKAG